jgi:hypothetical protein
LRFPTCELQANGYDVIFDGSLPGQFDPVTHQFVGVDPVESDVVVLQRPLKRILADLIPHLQARGVAVVVEVDDDFSCMPPTNPTWLQAHPRQHPDRNWEHLARACRQADLVTVSTPALARRYGGHGRVVVLPNFVPARYLDVVAEPNERVMVGWAGSPHTHPGDLEVMGGVVARVLAQTGAGFHAVGSARTLEALGVDGRVTEWAPLLDGYPQAVASLDVGLVPLALTEFARAKSWLKGVEYAALGVPFIASPTDEYQRLHALGVGLLARKPRQWESLLRRLVTDSAFREDLAARGREVAKTLTVEEHAWKWWAAWETAVENRRRSRMVA